MKPTNPVVACFVTSHGFGHAARASAVLLALIKRQPDIQIELFTSTPRWFFEQTIGNAFHYHSVVNDVGIFQSTPLEENFEATIAKLAGFIPFDSVITEGLAEQLSALRCQFTLCDISPLGIAVSNQANIPSVLQENFTWDWIYQGYLQQEPRFQPYIQYLAGLYASAGYHIQTDPVCDLSARCELVAHPVSRPHRTSRAATRQALGIPENARAVLITMGGIPPDTFFHHELSKFKEIFFILPGGSNTYQRLENLVLFPHHSHFYHPDLIHAVDAVLGKAGYSTIAETYYAGIPFGFISRANFREAPQLSRFILNRMPGFEISEHEYLDMQWFYRIPELFQLPQKLHNHVNGADQIAEALIAKYL